MSGYGFNYYKENKYVPKHITVDLGNQTAAKAGAAMSSRQVMDIVDEKGQKIRGFFTEDEYVNALKLFRSRAGQLKAPEGFDGLAEMSELIGAKCESTGDGMKHFTRKIAGIIGAASSSSLPDRWSALVDAYSYEIKEMLVGDFGVAEDALADFGNGGKTDDYVKTVIKSAYDGLVLEKTHIDHQLQSANGNINRRNNAMSDYAEKLGMSGLIAKSTSMTVTSGEKTMHGSFMVNAQGISFEELLDGTNLTGSRKLTVTYSALKDISSLQVIDFLCGNIDRHVGNMFYKVDDSDPNNLKLTGLQGIDNDASFGRIDSRVNSKGKIFDRMSLLRDIKIIDRDTAEKIKKLSFEEIGGMLRLAGLSKEEMNAASERLELLREKIEHDNIRIINGESGWIELSRDRNALGKYSSFSENVSFMGKRLPANHPARYMDNIFGNFHEIVSAYNSNPQPVSKKQFSAVKGTVPTAKTKNILDNYGLEDHIAGLEHIRDEYAELSAKTAPDADFAPVNDKLGSMIELMKKYVSKDRLTDMERNLLSEHLKDLSETADAFAQKTNIPDLENNEYHAAQNIKAYASFAREAIRSDALEAEMNMASKGADDIRRENEILPTAVTYPALAARVKAIEGRSTDYFKNMMRSFKKLETLSDNMTAREKRSVYNEIMRNSAAYIKHKAPKGTTAGLKPKEIARVRFARDLSEYAAANKQLLREKAENKERRDKEAKDYFTIAGIHGELSSFASKYRNAAAGEAKDKAQNDVLAAKTDFADKLNKFIEISEKYPPEHDMQAACGKMLSGGVADFMNVCLDCYNEMTGVKATDVYRVLRIDPSVSDKLRQIVENGKKVEEAYLKSHAPEQPKAQAGMSEKEAEPQLGEVAIENV